MGAGSVSEEKQPEPLEAGSAVSAILVRGDMDIAATCTVTYIDPQRLLACGHPLLQFGSVDLPMNKAQVLATLPFPSERFQDCEYHRARGRVCSGPPYRNHGRVQQTAGYDSCDPDYPQLVARAKEFHYEVLNNARLSPVAIMATVFNALHGVNEYGEEITYRLNGTIDVKGFPEVATARICLSPPRTDSRLPCPQLSHSASASDAFTTIPTMLPR
jgi:hypothetical protein